MSEGERQSGKTGHCQERRGEERRGEEKVCKEKELKEEASSTLAQYRD